MSGGGAGASGGVLGAGSSYQRFVHSALELTRLRTVLKPHPSQEKFRFIQPNDDTTVLNALSYSAPKIRMLRSLTVEKKNSVQEKFRFIQPNDDTTVLNALSYSAPKIRMLRSLTVEKKNSVQVLDFAAFSEPEYDLPIFCANAFTTPAQSIVVLDLNPLYDITVDIEYKDKYYRDLMPLVQKYSELLPWGGKITSESLRFFSPIVIWTIFEPTECNHDVLFSALTDYYKVWLQLTDQAIEENDAAKIVRNGEAQHRYLTWRTEKDPGYPLLKKLIGESQAKDLVSEFLFQGVNSLGSKSFLDYFPEYARDDGTVNKKRSMIGKSFETRPWDATGQFNAG